MAQKADCILSKEARSGRLGKMLNHVSGNASVAYEADGEALDRLETSCPVDKRRDALILRALACVQAAKTTDNASDRTEYTRLAAEYLYESLPLDAIVDEHMDRAAVCVTESRTLTYSIVRMVEPVVYPSGETDAAH